MLNDKVVGMLCKVQMWVSLFSLTNFCPVANRSSKVFLSLFSAAFSFTASEGLNNSFQINNLKKCGGRKNPRHFTDGNFRHLVFKLSKFSHFRFELLKLPLFVPRFNKNFVQSDFNAGGGDDNSRDALCSRTRTFWWPDCQIRM